MYENIIFSSKNKIHEDLIEGMVAAHLKVIRRKTYLAVGGCNEEWSGIQDWELALRISHHSYQFQYLPRPLYRYRVHQNSLTSRNFLMQFRKTNQIRRQYLEKKYTKSSQGFKTYVFDEDKWPKNHQELHQIWQNGGRCSISLKEGVSPRSINFLRKYGSYFDRISSNDYRLIVALYGFIEGRVSISDRFYSIDPLARATQSR